MKNLFVGLFFLTSFWTTATGKNTVLDLLNPSGVPEVEFWVDLDFLEKNKFTEEKTAGSVHFISQSGQVKSWNVQVSIRGNYRRRICDFPPLKLDFSKKELEAEGLLPFDDLKMVTHCLNSEVDADLVMREFLTYQLYQTLTPESFRTRLIQVTYRDTQSDRTLTSYAFLIEDTDALAYRINAEECDDCFGMTDSAFAPKDVARLALFQYMIGNTDWSVFMQRNVKILKSQDGSKFYTVPYDFDFATLVGSPYAIPNDNIGQKNFFQRIYMGVEVPKEDFESCRALFLNQKNSLLDIIRKTPLIDDKAKKDMLQQLEKFYNDLEKNKIEVDDKVTKIWG
ncbi:MAG TPA: hypothetical protein PKA00_05420 [Saprospiraceae bacterium]|nr:hypothetical protein [Saprospiraceae bacterium]HMQ82322.1 hypothetical protein [Saprospiraceae bacterium]